MKCRSCKKNIFQNEIVRFQDHSYHKRCLRCSRPECNRVLMLAMAESHRGEPYCRTCMNHMRYESGGRLTHKSRRTKSRPVLPTFAIDPPPSPHSETASDGKRTPQPRTPNSKSGSPKSRSSGGGGGGVRSALKSLFGGPRSAARKRRQQAKSRENSRSASVSDTHSLSVTKPNFDVESAPTAQRSPSSRKSPRGSWREKFSFYGAAESDEDESSTSRDRRSPRHLPARGVRRAMTPSASVSRSSSSARRQDTAAAGARQSMPLKLSDIVADKAIASGDSGGGADGSSMSSLPLLSAPTRRTRASSDAGLPASAAAVDGDSSTASRSSSSSTPQRLSAIVAARDSNAAARRLANGGSSRSSTPRSKTLPRAVSHGRPAAVAKVATLRRENSAPKTSPKTSQAFNFDLNPNAVSCSPGSSPRNRFDTSTNAAAAVSTSQTAVNGKRLPQQQKQHHHLARASTNSSSVSSTSSSSSRTSQSSSASASSSTPAPTVVFATIASGVGVGVTSDSFVANSNDGETKEERDRSKVDGVHVKTPDDGKIFIPPTFCESRPAVPDFGGRVKYYVLAAQGGYSRVLLLPQLKPTQGVLWTSTKSTAEVKAEMLAHEHQTSATSSSNNKRHDGGRRTPSSPSASSRSSSSSRRSFESASSPLELEQEATSSTLSPEQTTLVNAVLKDDVDEVKREIASSKQDLNFSLQPNGCTLLHAAAELSAEMLTTLIDSGADVNQTDERGRTALHLAASRGRTESVRLLIGAKADLDVPRRDKGCRTALHTAVLSGSLRCTQLLLDAQCDVSVCDDRGATPLYDAAKSGLVDLCYVLLEAGVRVDRACNSGATPLLAAAENGHLRVCKMLLDRGAKMEVRGDVKQPVVAAASRSFLRIIKLFVQRGLDLRADIDVALREAEVNAHSSMAHYLTCFKGKLRAEFDDSHFTDRRHLSSDAFSDSYAVHVDALPGIGVDASSPSSSSSSSLPSSSSPSSSSLRTAQSSTGASSSTPRYLCKVVRTGADHHEWHPISALHALPPHPCILPVVGFCRNFLPPPHQTKPAPEDDDPLPQPFALSSLSSSALSSSASPNLSPSPGSAPPKSPNLSPSPGSAPPKSPNLSPSPGGTRTPSRRKSPQLSPFATSKSPNKLSPHPRPRSQTAGSPSPRLSPSSRKSARAPPVSPRISPAPFSLVGGESTPLLSSPVPALVVPELNGPGSLSSYLKGSREISESELTHFALDMAKAVQHLHQQGFVHRDISVRSFQLARAPTSGSGNPPLAAWSAMGTESDYHSRAFDDALKSKDNFRARFRCVLSDFALARPFREDGCIEPDVDAHDTFENDSVYRHQHRYILPWRSSAPESLFEGRHYRESDVWMFGVALYELFIRATELPFGSIPRKSDEGNPIPKLYKRLKASAALGQALIKWPGAQIARSLRRDDYTSLRNSGGSGGGSGGARHARSKSTGIGSKMRSATTGAASTTTRKRVLRPPSDAIKNLVARCMSFDRRSRPPIERVVQELCNIIEDKPSTFNDDDDEADDLETWRRRGRMSSVSVTSPQISSIREAAAANDELDAFALGPLQEVKEEGDLPVKAPHNLSDPQRTDELLKAIAANDIDTVRAAVESPEFCPDAATSRGWTLLFEAAAKNRLDMAKLLIDAKCDVEHRDRYKYSPAILAARNNHADMLKLLVASGADVHSSSYPDVFSMSRALATDHNGDALQLLVDQGFNTDAVDEGGDSLKSIAKKYANKRCQQILDDAKDGGPFENGCTMLMHAAWAGHFDVVKVLLDLGVSTAQQDELHHSAADFARMGGHAAILTLLSEAPPRIAQTLLICDWQLTDKSPVSREVWHAHYRPTPTPDLLAELDADADGFVHPPNFFGAADADGRGGSVGVFPPPVAAKTLPVTCYLAPPGEDAGEFSLAARRRQLDFVASLPPHPGVARPAHVCLDFHADSTRTQKQGERDRKKSLRRKRRKLANEADGVPPSGGSPEEVVSSGDESENPTDEVESTEIDLMDAIFEAEADAGIPFLDAMLEAGDQKQKSRETIEKEKEEKRIDPNDMPPENYDNCLPPRTRPVRALVYARAKSVREHLMGTLSLQVEENSLSSLSSKRGSGSTSGSHPQTARREQRPRSPPAAAAAGQSSAPTAVRAVSLRRFPSTASSLGSASPRSPRPVPKVGATERKTIYSVALQMAQAVAHLHAHGYVHRNICAANFSWEDADAEDAADLASGLSSLSTTGVLHPSRGFGREPSSSPYGVTSKLSSLHYLQHADKPVGDLDISASACAHGDGFVLPSTSRPRSFTQKSELSEMDALYQRYSKDPLEYHLWRWMPPEMLASVLDSSKGRLMWSRACDVWQFGACLFELQALASHPERIVPFARTKSANDLLKVFEACERKDSSVPLNFSEEVSQSAFHEVIRRCMRIDSERRPSMDEVVDALRFLVENPFADALPS